MKVKQHVASPLKTSNTAQAAATNRCESIFSIAIFLHFPSGCSNADPVLSAQEAPATRRPAEAFLRLFAVKKDESELKSSQLTWSYNSDWRLKWAQFMEEVNSASTRIFGTGNQRSAQFQPGRPWWWRIQLSAGRWPSTRTRHKRKISHLRVEIPAESSGHFVSSLPSVSRSWVRSCGS